ncbi:acetyl xylan esterase [Pholiota molesta]|nr:acetyl xylan esterase [Pholiota molesta]
MFAFKAFFVAAAIASANALTSSLQQITANFGANPTNVQMYLYKPTALASPTPLIAYFSGTSLAQLADQHGFMVIYPNAPTAGGCWDVASTATLTHNGGSDSLGIANVVRYFIANMGIDSTQVFATGTSSGAMMTNVLMGAYPDIFTAGSLYSGVPYGCFAGPTAWNTQCATGQLIKTAQQWGDQVRSGYPGYTGARPKVQFWHGTADTTLYPQNFWEEIKQWTNIFGVSTTPTTNVSGDPQQGYSRASFGPSVQGILAQGVGHTVPEHETDTLDWFGLSSLTPGGSPGTTTTPPTTITTPTTVVPPPTTTVSPTSGTAAHWGQCGGIGWTGPTVCAAPYSCQAANAYYSQCL